MEYTGFSSAVYTYSLDLTNFSGFGATCNPSNGLSYHAHTLWTNSTVDSSSNAFCGAAYTSGHYDPSLACSSASEDIKSKCVSLGRTAASAWTYPCTADAYSKGNLALCEVGDFSGKFGALMPTVKGGSIFEGFVRDAVAPFTGNFKAVDAIANQWASVVFHCKDDASRILCANLKVEEGICNNY